MPSALHPTLRCKWASRRPSGVSQTPPLPSTALEYWHGELGASAANAVGQIAGHTLPGVNTPVVAADGSLFSGRTVYQASVTGTRYWYGNPGTITAAGTRPYVYIIGRYRTVPSATAGLSGIGRHFTGDRVSVLSTAAASLRAVFGRTGLGGVQQANGSVDTNVHRYEAWMDGTNRNFRVDGSNSSAADTDTVALADAVGIGCAAAAGGFDLANASVAFFLVCSAKPSDAEITALNEWATAYWGAP